MKKFIYTSLIRTDSDARIIASRYVYDKGFVPINLEIHGEYFPGRDAQNTEAMVRRADEVWVFGIVDKKVWEDVCLAKKIGKPLKFFIIEHGKVKEISEKEVKYDEEVTEKILEEKARAKQIKTISLDVKEIKI
ncbi:MAG: hypothetical protein QXP39_01865 [Candidatus Aenigmatarchaeota archaeon]